MSVDTGRRLRVTLRYAPWRREAVRHLLGRGDHAGLAVVLAELVDTVDLDGQVCAEVTPRMLSCLSPPMLRRLAAGWLQAAGEVPDGV